MNKEDIIKIPKEYIKPNPFYDLKWAEMMGYYAVIIQLPAGYYPRGIEGINETQLYSDDKNTYKLIVNKK